MSFIDTKKLITGSVKISFGLILFFSLAVIASAQEVWNDTDWTSYDTITIDSSNIDDDLIDFPVYLDLSDLSSIFWSSTPSSTGLTGTDIRVTTDTSSLNIDLSGNNITATDESGTHDFIGEVRRAQHSRLSTRSGGGGGTSSRVGTPAPAGDGEVTGGSNEGGELIGSNPNFYLPTANSGSWNNAPNAYDQEDGTYATDDSGTTNNFTNHSFVVNQTNSIQGIEIKLEVSGTTGAGDIDVELSYDGGTSWTTVKTTPTLTTTDTVVTLGGPADTWGRAWTPAEFSNANFQVRLSASPSANTIQVDAIQVRVYHQASAPAPGGGGGGRI